MITSAGSVRSSWQVIIFLWRSQNYCIPSCVRFSANQGLSKVEPQTTPRCLHPSGAPTSPCPTLSAHTEPMDIGRSDIMTVPCHLQMATSGKALMVLQLNQLKQCIVDVICTSEQTVSLPTRYYSDSDYSSMKLTRYVPVQW